MGHQSGDRHDTENGNLSTLEGQLGVARRPQAGAVGDGQSHCVYGDAGGSEGREQVLEVVTAVHPGPSDECSDAEADKGRHAQATYINGGISGVGGRHAVDGAGGEYTSRRRLAGSVPSCLATRALTA